MARSIQILPIGDPRLKRAHISAIIAGAPGAGKTPLLLRIAPKGVLVCDADGTIGRYAGYADNKAIIVPDCTYETLLRVIVDIEKQLIKPKILAIDDMTRIIAQLEASIGEGTPTSAYYRALKERVDTLMKRLLALPCHVLIIARERQVRAKVGDIIHGWMVGPGDSVVIDTAPDLPPEIESFVDVSIMLEDRDGTRSAIVRTSLFGEVLPQHARYDDPFVELPERFQQLFALTPATVEEAPAPAQSDAQRPAAPVATTVPTTTAAALPAAPKTAPNVNITTTPEDELRNMLSIIRDLGGTTKLSLKEYFCEQKLWKGDAAISRPDVLAKYKNHMETHIAELRTAHEAKVAA